MKILCPYHEDTNPSMEVYDDYSHCFVCGAHVPNRQVGVKSAKVLKKTPTDIKTEISYIQTLPTRRIRGLDVPYDSKGFYIVWPSGQFYKRRSFQDEARYLAPTGVKAPLLKYSGKLKTIAVIEGELNAISAYESIKSSKNCEYATIASPGAATEFKRFIGEYLGYDRIILILDSDAAGIVAGLETKEMLLKLNKHASLVLKDTDYNDTLQLSGISEVKYQFMKDTE